jgi:hypothetical protein
MRTGLIKRLDIQVVLGHFSSVVQEGSLLI